MNVRACGTLVALFFVLDTASAEQKQRAATPADSSLTVAEYVELGVSPPERAWTVAEQQACAVVLADLESEKLPRLDSTKSGAIFRRMIAEENPGQKTAATLKERATSSSLALAASNKHLVTYALAFESDVNVDYELAELVRLLLRQYLGLIAIIEEPEPDLSPERKAQKSAVIAQVSSGSAAMFSGMVMMLSVTEGAKEKALHPEARRALADHLATFAPKYRKHFSPESRESLRLEVEKLRAAEKDKKVDASLAKILETVSAS